MKGRVSGYNSGAYFISLVAKSLILMMSSIPVTATATRTIPPRVYLVIAVGVLAMSFAAIFIRFAQNEGVPSLVIAAGRLAVASLVLTPFVFQRHWDDIKKLRRDEWLLGGASGVLLAIHFATWIASLEYTSVLLSVVLVSTGSLWVALLEFVFLRARFTPLLTGGLIVALIGGIVIGAGGGDDLTGGQTSLLGAGLATAGAIAFAGYMIIGRKLRARLPLIPYIWVVYASAALVLLLAVGVSSTSISGYSASGYFWLLLLGLVPQLIGHSSSNYAVKYLPATLVSIASQMEPVGSAVAAFILFNERPAPIQLLGSAAIIVGVAIAVWGQGRREGVRVK